MPKGLGRSKRKQAPTSPKKKAAAAKKKMSSLGKKVADKATGGIAKQRSRQRKASKAIG